MKSCTTEYLVGHRSGRVVGNCSHERRRRNWQGRVAHNKPMNMNVRCDAMRGDACVRVKTCELIEHTWDVLDDLPQVGALGRTHGQLILMKLQMCFPFLLWSL